MPTKVGTTQQLWQAGQLFVMTNDACRPMQMRCVGTWPRMPVAFSFGGVVMRGYKISAGWKNQRRGRSFSTTGRSSAAQGARRALYTGDGAAC